MMMRVRRKTHCLAVLVGLVFVPGPALASDGGNPSLNALMPQRATQPETVKPRSPKPRRTRARPADARPAATPRPRRTVAPRRQPAVSRPAETAPSGQPPQGEDRFLADEVIVRYRLASSAGQRDALVRRLGLRHIEARTFALSGSTVHRYAIAFGAPLRATIAALEADPTVVYAQPNYLYVAQQAPAAAAVPQYALDRLVVRNAHAVSRGAGVTLAIVDSAVDAAHPEFTGAALEAFDVRDTDEARSDPHGTSIAGVIAARGTLTGIAPEARILAIASFAPDAEGRIRGSTWSVAKALDLAHSNGARLLNLSFAGPADPLVERSLRGAARRQMIAVAASGNEGPDAAPLYPAAYPSVMAVTATDASDGLYPQASGGSHVALAAPGVEIVTVAPGEAFGVASGTSLATAHVTGLAALLLSADPSLDPQRLSDILEGAASDLGEPGRDPRFGFGLPNAEAALKALATH